MNRYKHKSGPNKLLEAETWKLDPEGTLGLVALETEHGDVMFAINRGYAELLRDQMQAFLDGNAEAFPT